MKSQRKLVAVLCLLAAVVSGCSRDPNLRKQEFLESGNRYFEKGDFRAAIIEYRNAVDLDPVFAPARAKLAESYARIGDGGNAINEFVRAADLLPDDIELQLKTGALLLSAGQADQALVRADAALKRQPQNVTAFVLRGNALAGLNSFDKALDAIEEAIRLDPKRGLTFTQKGLIALASGQREQAEAAFLKAVELAPESVDARLALGNYYWSVGRREETEKALQAALNNEPDDVAANRAMAVYLVAIGKANQAEPYLRRIADTRKDPASVLALADYYLLVGRNQDAISRLTPLANSESPVPGSRPRLARAYAASGEKAKARELVEAILAAEKTNTEAALLQAQFLIDDRKPEQALAAVQEAVKANPSSAEAQFALGRLYAARGDAAAAESAFREVLRLNPRVTAAQVELSRLRLSAGDTQASVRSAEEATRNDPGDLAARITLIRSLLAAREGARAERELAPLRSQYPDLPDVRTQSGALAMLKNDKRTARDEFERALALDQNSIEALTGLIQLDVLDRNTESAKSRIDARLKAGASAELLLLAARTYATLGDAAGAEGFLRRAIDAEPTLLPAYAMLGQLYLSQNKLDSARREFENMAARQTRPVAALTMSGIILQTQGNSAEARKRYEQALAVDSRAAVAANNLAWMMAEGGGNLDLALQLGQTAVAAAPNLPDVTDTLGWIYYKKNLPNLAVAQFQRSIELAPNVAIYHHHLGLAYAQSGDKERARSAFQKALSSSPDQRMTTEINHALAKLTVTSARK